MRNLLKVLLLGTVLVAVDSYAYDEFPGQSDGTAGYGFDMNEYVRVPGGLSGRVIGTSSNSLARTGITSGYNTPTVTIKSLDGSVTQSYNISDLTKTNGVWSVNEGATVATEQSGWLNTGLSNAYDYTLGDHGLTGAVSWVGDKTGINGLFSSNSSGTAAVSSAANNTGGVLSTSDFSSGAEIKMLNDTGSVVDTSSNSFLGIGGNPTVQVSTESGIQSYLTSDFYKVNDSLVLKADAVPVTENGGFLDTISDWGSTAWDYTGGAVWTGTKNLASGAADLGGQALDTIGEGASWLGTTATKGAVGLTDTIKGWGNTGNTVVSSVPEGLAEQAPSAYESVANSVVDVSPEAINDAVLASGTLTGEEAANVAGAAAGKAADATTAATDALSKTNPAEAANTAKQTAASAAEGSTGLWDKIKEALFGKRTITYNYGQYALLVIEAIKANEIKDATKEVKIKGADGLGGSQGSSNPTSGTQTTPSTVLNGTTLGDSITAMIELLRTNTIDISLLSEDFEQKKETTTSTGPVASISSGGSASQTGTETGTVPTTPDSDNGEDEDSLTTEQEAELRKRRVLLAMEWAVAAQQIGEGSNAISSKFYDRAATFVSAANAANGSLGGISTINDTDRFVLFELTRGAALSAMQLGLQASTTLSETKVKIERSEADSGSSGGADSSVSASSSRSQ